MKIGIRTQVFTILLAFLGWQLQVFAFESAPELTSASPGGAPEPIEEAVLDEIQRLHDEAPSQDELDRVVRQTRAKRAISLESVTAQAVQLGMLEMAASWRLSQTLTDDLQRVTPADVRRVARTYLREPSRVTGWFLPAAANGAAA